MLLILKVPIFNVSKLQAKDIYFDKGKTEKELSKVHIINILIIRGATLISLYILEG